jgi:hypothetical protein
MIGRIIHAVESPFKVGAHLVMNFAEIITAAEAATALYSELKSDGTLADLQKAEETVLTLYKNPKVQALLTSLETLGKHVSTSAVASPVVATK